MNEHNLRWIPARVLVDGVFPCFVMACVGRGICRKEEYRNSSTANTSRTTPSEFVDSRATPEAVWTMTVARLLIKSKIPREYSASSVLPIVDCSHSPNLPPMLRRVAPFFCIGSTCTKAYCGASPFAFSLTTAARAGLSGSPAPPFRTAWAGSWNTGRSKGNHQRQARGCARGETTMSMALSSLGILRQPAGCVSPPRLGSWPFYLNPTRLEADVFAGVYLPAE